MSVTNTFSHTQGVLLKQESDHVFYEEHFEKIQDLIPEYSLETIKSLKVHREGIIPESNMTTLGLHVAVRKNLSYQVTSQGLIEKTKNAESRILELFNNTPFLPSKYAEVEAIWDKNYFDDGKSDNILGGNGRFKIDSSFLNIPIVEANDTDLSYYGATIVNKGDIVEFSEDVYPIWYMSIGRNYVDEFIMKKNGFYLEYHNDKPHFHMPLSEDAGGFYILAKLTDIVEEKGKGKYHITGFRIPFGKGVYTKNGAIHCDAGLTGKQWLVGYTNAEDYSTVLIRNHNDEIVKVKDETIIS